MERLTRRLSFFTFSFFFFFLAKGQNEFYEKGMVQIGKKNYESAIKLFTKSLEKNEKDIKSYFQRANSYVSIRDYQAAYNDLTKCVELDGTFAEAYWVRGDILFISGNYPEALNDENMAVKYAKDTLINHALILRASCKLALRNFSGAQDDCYEALKRDSLDLDALINLSSALAESNRLDQSIPILQKVLRLDSSNALALTNLGYEYGQLGNHAESIKYLSISIKKDPKNAFALSNRSYSLMKIGKIKEAFKDVNTSIELAPDNSYAYRNLGLIYLENKEKEKACETFQLALKKGFTEMYGKEVKELIEKNCKAKD